MEAESNSSLSYVLFLKEELDKNGYSVQALLFVFLKVEIT